MLGTWPQTTQKYEGHSKYPAIMIVFYNDYAAIKTFSVIPRNVWVCASRSSQEWNKPPQKHRITARRKKKNTHPGPFVCRAKPIAISVYVPPRLCFSPLAGGSQHATPALRGSVHLIKGKKKIIMIRQLFWGVLIFREVLIKLCHRTSKEAWTSRSNWN